MDVRMGDEWPKRLTRKINFFVMDENVFSAYNLIIGRVALKEFEVVPSTVHQMLKFPTPYGVGEVQGDQTSARECYFNSTEEREAHKRATKLITLIHFILEMRQS